MSKFNVNVAWTGLLAEITTEEINFNDRVTGAAKKFKKITARLVDVKTYENAFVSISDRDADLNARAHSLIEKTVTVEVAAPERDNGVARGRMVDLVLAK